MNHTHLYVASRDHIFIFSLKEMQQIALIKAPNHLLRIAMSPNYIKGMSRVISPKSHAQPQQNQSHLLNASLNKYNGHEFLLNHQANGGFPFIAYSEMLNNGTIQFFNTISNYNSPSVAY